MVRILSSWWAVILPREDLPSSTNHGRCSWTKRAPQMSRCLLQPSAAMASHLCSPAPHSNTHCHCQYSCRITWTAHQFAYRSHRRYSDWKYCCYCTWCYGNSGSLIQVPKAQPADGSYSSIPTTGSPIPGTGAHQHRVSIATAAGAGWTPAASVVSRQWGRIDAHPGWPGAQFRGI